MLITCPECEEIVSNRAEYCPHCGCPNKYLIEVEPFDSYIIGKKVKHKKYGEGIVVSFADGIMEIEFEGNGIKEFALDSFVNFFTSDIKTTNKILNEIKIGTIEAKIKEAEI